MIWCQKEQAQLSSLVEEQAALVTRNGSNLVTTDYLLVVFIYYNIFKKYFQGIILVYCIIL